MTFAISSVNGQLGRAVVAAFTANQPDTKLVGLARTPSKADDLQIEVRPGDYDDQLALTQSLLGVDTVLMISGNAPPQPRVIQQRNMIAATKAAGVRKMLFTSVQGRQDGPADGVTASMRQTELDLRNSGLAWAIGRNGVYIEPDVEYAATYIADGEITNCAGEAKCGYTTRPELGYAYTQLMLGDAHVGGTFNLNGTPISQAELAAHIGHAFGVDLPYRSVSYEAFLADRAAALGPELGAIIAGIYQGISSGIMDNPSDFAAVAGRQHQTWDAFFASVGPGF